MNLDGKNTSLFKLHRRFRGGYRLTTENRLIVGKMQHF